MKKLFPDQIDEETARRKPPIQFTRMVHAFSGKPRAQMLESHDERALILRWQDKGDPDAMETLLHAYDGWLRSITLRTCAGRGYSGDIEDAHGVAVLGFIESCNKFDFGRRARISTFSKYRVVGEISAYINRSGYPVAVGTSSDERMAQRHRKMLLDLFRDETGRDWGATPQDAETLARLSGIPASAGSGLPTSPPRRRRCLRSLMRIQRRPTPIWRVSRLRHCLPMKWSHCPGQ